MTPEQWAVESGNVATRLGVTVQSWFLVFVVIAMIGLLVVLKR